MSDVVVTVPKGRWQEWIAEGDLPGDPWTGYANHFWIRARPLPVIGVGERVYIVAHGKLRGWAPLDSTELRCRLRPQSACLIRKGGAFAVTIDRPIVGFRGWRYRDWERDEERPFPDWRTP